MTAETQALPSAVRIRRRSRAVADDIRLFERYVRRFERKYGRSSAEMAEAVLCGEADCSAEVDLWLARYRHLQDLRALAGPTGGRTTTST